MVTKTIENLQAELAELDLTEAELRADPCLASCCLKDIKERREVAVVKQKLLSHDPTAQRQNLRATPLGAAHLQAVTQAQPSEDSDAGSDAGGDSQALADIRARRLRELQRSAEAQRSQSQQGAGQLQDVPESQLLERLESSSGCCVCHLAVTGYQPCDELDQCLEGLAHRYRGTRFIRCAPGRKSRVYAALGVGGAPQLICLRDGAVIGRSPLEMFGPTGEIFEEEVVKYLKRLSVLRADQPSNGRNGQGNQSDGEECSDIDSGSESETRDGHTGGPRVAPCETCGRCYPHTHVKALHASTLPYSDEEDNSDLD